ncbi:MAG: 2-amino-4-hydroxy-6-hydroxymethyldihydropteridine diphosphokinase [Verrucomicrobiota bacterium]|nr:2-amino-4-hydroxy-6-hydroxymethyldihydropteridine diphosphokinase [Verrucomicrobiota bacterium]
MNTGAIGIGSNIGDLKKNISLALKLLKTEGIELIRQAESMKTTPLNCPEKTPDFLNTAIICRFSCSPEKLLKICKKIETQMGRPIMHAKNSSRIIDLDILLIKDISIQSKMLTVPHPEMLKREFVLKPLFEIAPDWNIPGTSLTIEDAMQKL